MGWGRVGVRGRGGVGTWVRVLGVQSRAALGDQPLVILLRDRDETRALVRYGREGVGLDRVRVRVRPGQG